MDLEHPSPRMTTPDFQEWANRNAEHIASIEPDDYEVGDIVVIHFEPRGHARVLISGT